MPLWRNGDVVNLDGPVIRGAESDLIEKTLRACGRTNQTKAKRPDGFAVWPPELLLGLIQGFIAHSELKTASIASRSIQVPSGIYEFVSTFLLTKYNHRRTLEQIVNLVKDLRRTLKELWLDQLLRGKPNSHKSAPEIFKTFERPSSCGDVVRPPPDELLAQPTLFIFVNVDPVASPMQRLDEVLVDSSAPRTVPFNSRGVMVLSPWRIGSWAAEVFKDVDSSASVVVVDEDNNGFVPRGRETRNDMMLWAYSSVVVPQSMYNEFQTRTKTWTIQFKLYAWGLHDTKPFAEIFYYFPVSPPASRVVIPRQPPKSRVLVSSVSEFQAYNRVGNPLRLIRQEPPARRRPKREGNPCRAQAKCMREIDFAQEREQLVLDASIFVGSASSSARMSVERELEVVSGSGSPVEEAQSQCPSPPALVPYGPDAGVPDIWGERYSSPHLPVPEARWVDLSEISQGDSSQSVSTSQSDYATSNYSSLSDWDKMRGPVTGLPSAALNIASDSKCSCCTSRASKNLRTPSSSLPTRSRGQVKSRPSPMAAVPSAARPGYGSRRSRAHQRIIPVPQAVVGCPH